MTLAKCSTKCQRKSNAASSLHIILAWKIRRRFCSLTKSWVGSRQYFTLGRLLGISFAIFYNYQSGRESPHPPHIVASVNALNSFFPWEHLGFEPNAFFTNALAGGELSKLDLNIICLRPTRTFSMEVPAGTVFALTVNYDHLLILSRLKTGAKFFSTGREEPASRIRKGEEHAQQHAS